MTQVYELNPIVTTGYHHSYPIEPMYIELLFSILLFFSFISY